MENLVGKSFLLDGEEFVVEQMIVGGHEYICRCHRMNTGERFSTHFVRYKVEKYREYLEEENAFVFKEEGEKDLLKIAVLFFVRETPMSELNAADRKHLCEIMNKVGI